MADFIHINTEKINIFDQEVKIQVRATQENTNILDSFIMDTVETDVYVVIWFYNEFSGPNYQLSLQTELADTGPYNNSYCSRCTERKTDVTRCEVWFRSSKSSRTQSLCKDCTRKMLRCKQFSIDQTPKSTLTSYTI